MKICIRCKQNPQYDKTKKKYCKECEYTTSQASKYGVSYEEMKLLRQKTHCEICTLPFKTDKARHIDHDHDTGVIRGVLCHKCNVMLGYARDNTQILKNGIKYLESQLYCENNLELL